MEELKFLSWNIRGIGNDVAKYNLRRLLGEVNPTVLLIQETKAKKWSDYNTESLLSSNQYEWCDQSADGLSGGLLMCWDGKKLICKSANMQWCRGKVLESCVINVVNIYGPHEISEKKYFWENLGNLVRNFATEPLCLMGDFNCVRDSEEVESCEFSLRASSILNDFIMNHNLIEIKDPEVKFTWFGPKNKRSKLDRVLINDLWSQNHNWMIKGWCRRSSDHKPISLQICDAEWGPKPFKAFNVWLQEESMRILIADLLVSETNVCSILRRFKDQIKSWSTGFNKGLNGSIAQLEVTLGNLENSKIDPMVAADYTHQLRSLYGKQMEYMKQKSRQMWDKLGDSNSRFFHQVVKSRMASNQIKKFAW